jgi:hypothetical protein
MDHKETGLRAWSTFKSEQELVVDSCECGNETLGSTKRQGIHRPGKQLPASQGQRSLKLTENVTVSYFGFTFLNGLVSSIFRVKIASEL